ncbi:MULTISPECIES: tetratricopeptide repeat protein [Thiothrix]|jgi:tetratricopeptide (TPR) repeat protein|uniref:Tetratricopeptide repeat protein n=1 Tax=Thiothrix unzii TaxID=111769 RepID=A0A975FAA2_9GAMM|nr:MULTISPECIES: tetratricopeptide repeat protein [Thiothrix]QTR54167.1 tetratricopeptide repeat protein [Thiothrix unzii]
MKLTRTLLGLCLIAVTTFSTLAHAAGDVAELQQEWARIKYQLSGKDAKLQAIHALEETAAQAVAANPNSAELLIWQGIILATDAGIVKGMSALGNVKQAKALFEKSLQLNPTALDGSAQASLGSLYYQVPGWPVAFGDDTKAEEHLKAALKINPNSIDANYFYGDFLLQAKRYDEAVTYLNAALNAPDRPGRQVADTGRRQEIKQALAKAQK